VGFGNQRKEEPGVPGVGSEPSTKCRSRKYPENIPNPQSREDFAISESVQKWKTSKETATSLLMSVLGDDIVSDLKNELGDPAAMWKTLEDTYSSKTGTNTLTIWNGVVTKKARPHMSTNIGHLDSLFYQLTNIQGRDEANENGLKKDLTITGDIFKICMLLVSITEVGEYDAVIEAIRGVSDEGGATSYRAVKNRLLESYNEKDPGSGSIFDHKRNHRHGGNHRHGQSVRVAIAKDDKSCNGLGELGKGGRGGTRACSTRSRYLGDVARSSSLSARTRLPFTHGRQKI
jgi:gag-polypeptide of LTR copia-type